MRTKTIVIGSLLASIAALFQLMPVFYSEVFLFLTIFSAVPIYLVARISPKAGLLSYIVAAMLVMIFSMHEGLFFLFTNGIVGLSLGICSFYTEKRRFICTLSSIILTIALVIINYGIGIPIFGSKIPGIMVVQIAIIFLVSTIYIISHYYFSSFIYRFIKNRLKGY